MPVIAPVTGSGEGKQNIKASTESPPDLTILSIKKFVVKVRFPDLKPSPERRKGVYDDGTAQMESRTRRH